MTAITAILYDRTTTPSTQFKHVDFTSGNEGDAAPYTYTPIISSGKTIRVSGCYLAGGSACKASVSSNVITIVGGGDSEKGVLTFVES